MFLKGQEHTLCSSEVKSLLEHTEVGYSATVFEGAVCWMKVSDAEPTKVGKVDILTAKVEGEMPPKTELACMYSGICPDAEIALCD